jgi:hypothetical protein
MKIIRSLCLLGLASGMAFAQANPPSSTNVADEMKSLREAIAAQQKQIAEQQKQLEALERQLESQTAPTPHVENASLTNAPANNTPAVQSDADKPKTSPLSVRIGGTEFTPGGFVDFNNIFRTVNTGSVVSTGFNAIPYSNTPQGHLTEFRSTGQYSRFNLRINGKYGENNFNGYIEGDFNGNDAGNVFVTTNPHTFRLRLYYLQLRRGIWEFTAGQAWGLLTPNKVGVSTTPSELDTTMATDGNIHVGVMYSRQGQFRVAVHPNDHFAWAVSVENPQQMQITAQTLFPGAASLANIPTQADGTAAGTVPNLFPDIVTKFAFDTKPHGHNFHLEAGALVTSAQLANQPAAGAAFVKNSTIGGGGFGGLNFAITSKLRALGYGMYGDGVGRYFIGFGPQFVAKPVAITPTTFTAKPSMVHSGSGFGGLEFQASAKTQIGAYYGGIYYQRNAFTDISVPTLPVIGFGGITASAAVNAAANKSIQQGSLIISQTLWKNPQFGALVLLNDASYSTRAPWFHPATAPKNAHMFMDHLVLRYVIP